MRRIYVVIVGGGIVAAIVIAGVVLVPSSSGDAGSVDPGIAVRISAASDDASGSDNATVSPDVTAAGAIDQQSTVVQQGNGSLRTWREHPRVMESLVLAQLQQVGLPATSIDPVECTDTECLIRFVSLETDPYPDGIRSFIGLFRESPIAAIDARWGFETTDAGYEYTVTLSSLRFPPLIDTEPGQFLASADNLRELAAASLPPDDYNAPPSLVFTSTIGDQVAMVVAENVCTYDCAEDGRQVIHIVVPDGATCEQLRGVEQLFMARTRVGGLEERRFCIPNTLVGD